ncbi:YceI family protein [bacterium SCSIO 12741]|nr:YceI family protein [bacterium SCSIO 12741]
MKYWTGLFMVASIMLTACGGESGSNETETKKENLKLDSESCSYTIDPASVSVDWTAFKFTERTGVGGTFDSVSVVANGTKENPAQLLNDAQLSIYTSSVNSNNADRDKKIGNRFFGNLTDGEMMQGEVVAMNEEENLVEVRLTMNGKQQIVTMDYEIDGLSLTLKGSVDLAEWEATAAVDSLNAVCYELHKGEDGVSKLWNDVDITVKALLEKKCN